MNKIFIYVIAFFAILGGVDKLIGNKFGLGEKFQEGFQAMGNLSLGIIGIYLIAPFISKMLLPIMSPLFNIFKLDPSLFMGSILACDMGGYASSIKIAQTREMGLFSGLVIASMLGATVVYTIPIALGVIEKEDYPFFAKGISSGIITIPLGAVVSAIFAKMNMYVILKNLVPIIIFSVILAILLIKVPKRIVKIFYYFNKFITILGTIGLIIGILKKLTGISIIGEMEPFYEGLKIVGNIAIFLAGAYPMMHVITKVATKPLSKACKTIGIEESTAFGLIISLANNIPTFTMLKKMDKRGKVMCCAFSVSGAFSFGGQIGFVASVESSMMIPVMIGKLVAGISATILAYFIMEKEENAREINCIEAATK